MTNADSHLLHVSPTCTNLAATLQEQTPAVQTTLLPEQPLDDVQGSPRLVPTVRKQKGTLVNIPLVTI